MRFEGSNLVLQRVFVLLFGTLDNLATTAVLCEKIIKKRESE